MNVVLGLLAIIASSLTLVPSVFGQIEDNLGTIIDLVPDGTRWYYFETEKDSRFATWIADTRIKVADGKTNQNLSERLFIYPTELMQDKNNLYFAALSEKCIGEIFCDYQDLYKMSKKDGTTLILSENLKSAIHLSIEGDFIYISESSGNIWKISKNDGSKELVIKANELIMDLAINEGKVYWIEELADQNNNILALENGKSRIIAEKLKVPYDLTVQKDILYWNEIQVKPHIAGFSEFTSIGSYNNKHNTIMEFQNTSPISVASGESHYKPYLVFDDYLFLVNNTRDEAVIHMINLYNSTKYDVGVISGYDAKYLRTDGQSLFVIGINQDGFIIDRHSLPMVVPEFPNVILAIMPIALISAVILSRFSHSLSR